jgi:putative endonuclease
MEQNNTKYKKEIGNKGEELAVKFLEDLGYIIIQRNYKYGQEGEIDIIAKDANVLVFVEVKTRTNHLFGDPLLSVTKKKITLWKRTAEAFMFKNHINNQECRCDFIAIDLLDNSPKITHLINAC